MLRKTLIAATLLAASAAALAHGAYVYGGVVAVAPRVSVAYHSVPYGDGFRIVYEAGGAPYWVERRPGYVAWVPRPAGYYLPRRHDWDDRRDWDDRYRRWDRHHDHDGHRDWD